MMTIGELIRSQMTGSDEATPEGLRAAAKVLEDKAKELDKPKFTDKQQTIVDFCDAHCGVNPAKFEKRVEEVKGRDYPWARMYETNTYAERCFVAEDLGIKPHIKIQRELGTFTKAVDGHLMHFKVVLDEFNDVETYIDINS